MIPSFSLNTFLFFNSHDSLQIYDGTQRVIEERGKITKSVIQATQSQMKIHFNSDHIGTRKGFQIKLQFFLSSKFNQGLWSIKLKSFKAHITINMFVVESLNKSFSTFNLRPYMPEE